MGFEITYDQQPGIVESRVVGVFDSNLVDQMAPALAKTVAETKSRLILIDFRNAPISMSTMKIYNTPEKLFEEFITFGVDLRSIKRAILVSQPNADFEFLEVVTNNQGQNFKIFTDREKALEWLLDSTALSFSS